MRTRFALALPLVVAALAFLLSPSASAQSGGPAQLSLNVPSEAVKAGGPDFAVDVAIDGVTNLGAFQFSLTYDPSIIRYSSVDAGPFLGSSGRSVKCLEPRVEAGSPETLQFTCVTLDAPVSIPDAVEGPSGSGVLASVKFSPQKKGNTALGLQDVTLVAADADETGMPPTIDGAGSGASLDVAAGGRKPSDFAVPFIAIVAVVAVVALAVVFGIRGGGGGSDPLRKKTRHKSPRYR
jgi:hypothetical protein